VPPSHPKHCTFSTYFCCFHIHLCICMQVFCLLVLSINQFIMVCVCVCCSCSTGNCNYCCCCFCCCNYYYAALVSLVVVSCASSFTAIANYLLTYLLDHWIGCCGCQDCSVDEIRDELPDSQPRFIVYSYCYQHDDGRKSYPLCFIFVSPQGYSRTYTLPYLLSAASILRCKG